MSKFHDLFEDIKELFINELNKIDSLRDLNVAVIGNNHLKEIYKVSKANELTSYLSEDGIDVIIQVNEEIFETLEDRQKAYIIDEALAMLYVDSESGRLKIIQPDFSGFSLVMLKYGIEESVKTAEVIKAAFAQKKEQDAENNVAEN
jgi:hypothetical protein